MSTVSISSVTNNTFLFLSFIHYIMFKVFLGDEQIWVLLKMKIKINK